jgi:hypothetical protein
LSKQVFADFYKGGEKMNNQNENAFPDPLRANNTCNYNECGQTGLTKLEYFTLKIFCAFGLMFKEGSELEPLRKLAIEQAKLLLAEIE